jgi:hypothetical protein
MECCEYLLHVFNAVEYLESRMTEVNERQHKLQEELTNLHLVQAHLSIPLQQHQESLAALTAAKHQHSRQMTAQHVSICSSTACNNTAARGPPHPSSLLSTTGRAQHHQLQSQQYQLQLQQQYQQQLQQALQTSQQSAMMQPNQLTLQQHQPLMFLPIQQIHNHVSTAMPSQQSATMFLQQQAPPQPHQSQVLISHKNEAVNAPFVSRQSQIPKFDPRHLTSQPGLNPSLYPSAFTSPSIAATTSPQQFYRHMLPTKASASSATHASAVPVDSGLQSSSPPDYN